MKLHTQSKEVLCYQSQDMVRKDRHQQKLDGKQDRSVKS